VTVRYEGGEPEGLASMLGELIEQNLLRDPRRHRLLRPATVVVRARDAGVTVSIRMRPGDVFVVPGVDPAARVRIIASGRDLLAMAGAPLRFGLPDLTAREGRSVIAGILAGRIRVRGLLTRLPVVRRFTMLLSAN
jgi:hypothetical protein